MPKHHWIDQELATLNPDLDHARMVDLMLNWRDSEPFLHHLIYTLGFARQVADPGIAAIVERQGAGALIRATRERGNETLRFFGAWWRHGPDSAKGRESIERLNAIHGRFQISNEQYLYTLATLVVLPGHLYALIGAPQRPPHERQALVRFWQRVGQAMHLHDIPADAEAFEQYFDRHERANFRPSPQGQLCMKHLVDDFVQRWYADRPALGRSVLLALCDERLRQVFDFDYPGPLLTRWRRLGLLMQGLRKRLLPQPRTPQYVDDAFTDHGRAPHA